MFLDDRREIIYIGKALNIRRRVSSYFLSKDLGAKTSVLVSKIRSIQTIPVESELEAFLLEAYLIKKHNPRYNSRLTDGKNYPYVLVDTVSKYPNIRIVRKPREDGNTFGPFPNSGDLRYVLKLIRKIFPYQSAVNHPKKKCLYNHLGLCPCPPLLSDDELLKYRRSTFHIIKFLRGDTKGLLSDLEKERDKKSKQEDFEDARDIQAKIEKIKSITTSFIRPVDYDLNPNLKEDLAQKSLNAVEEILTKHGFTAGMLNRIECFDISNTAGEYSVGSMVVFIDGEKDSSSYRRFKIKNPPKVIPNDFAMMSEILERRLKRNDWPAPDLIIIDGGKGQVSAAKIILKKLKKTIPLIGLAKREETIITPEMKEVRLKRGSPEYKLLTAIRNEAHRFAITYHRKLRSKMVFER